MADLKRFSLVRPTLDTPFHIDFDWWKEHDNNWRVYLHDCLCTEHQNVFTNLEDDSFVDWVNPVTAEVHRVDGLQQVLMQHCAHQLGFLTASTSLVDSVFRLFISLGNRSMTPRELAEKSGKQADMILRTLGTIVYKGIRPFKS